MTRLAPLLVLTLLAAPTVSAPPAAVPNAPPPGSVWPMYGGTPGRNMVNLVDADPLGWRDADKPVGILWKADLGSRAYGHPVVAAGKVFVGTNNERPRNKRDIARNKDGEDEPIDRGVLMCFEEKTGKFLWQAVFPKLESGMVNDWPKEGLCSSPAVEGGRLYFVTNRCTVVCADVNGRLDGVQGIKRPGFEDPTDADILWEYDMIRELKVLPHNASACHPLVVGDLVFVCTSNGVAEDHITVPSPDAPSFIALNKHTGKLVWKDNSPGKNILHGQWASPAYTADPVPQVIFPGGDGWLRAFDPTTGKLLWKFDGNPKDAVYEIGGSGTRKEFVAAPSIHDGKLYIGIGQDPEHTDGLGRLWCIDIRKATENAAKRPDRDVSPELPKPVEVRPGQFSRANPGSAAVWCFTGEDRRPFADRDYRIGRMIGGVTVVDGVAYAADQPGFVHAFDAATGERYWEYDTKTSIWTTPYFVGGKVLVGTDNGDLLVFRHDKKPEVIDDQAPAAPDRRAARVFRIAKQKEITAKYLVAKIEFDSSVRNTPCVAGGVLYVVTEKTLYAVGKR